MIPHESIQQTCEEYIWNQLLGICPPGWREIAFPDRRYLYLEGLAGEWGIYEAIQRDDGSWTDWKLACIVETDDITQYYTYYPRWNLP
jgi:hypothetical protein